MFFICCIIMKVACFHFETRAYSTRGSASMAPSSNPVPRRKKAGAPALINGQHTGMAHTAPNDADDDYVPDEVLISLWAIYGASLINCHFEDAVVSEVWNSFQAILTESPLTTHVNGPSSASSQRRGAKTELSRAPVAFFELTMNHLVDTQRVSLTEMPLTLLPLLEFLKALVAWREHAKFAKGEAASSIRPSDGLKTTESIALPRNSFSQSRGGDASPLIVDPLQTRIQCVIWNSASTASSAGGGDKLGQIPVVTFDDLGARNINKLVFVVGTVVRMSSPRVVCSSMAFRCNACGNVVMMPLEGGPMIYPTGCNGRCKGFFSAATEQSQTEELQLLKIQDQQQPGGGQQQTNRLVEIELRGTWMDTASAGDVICVGGVVSTRRGGDKQAGATRQLCLRAVSVQSIGAAPRLRRSNLTPMMSEGVDFDRAAEYYEIAKSHQWFHRLVVSLCPGIVGMYDVKSALLAALAGGTEKAHTRSNIHVLLIGDPGLGKSQLLRAASAAAPRSSMACATSSSSCGLTITLSRDPQTGEATFEAGAVVHGDGGVTCIDEIDKGSSEHKALLEVMEQNTISMAKAGMIFSMPISTSIIAAGNPSSGKFLSNKSITENLNLNAALLSRFDIIFLLKDSMRSEGGIQKGAAASMDAVTTHVLQMHRRKVDPAMASVAAADKPLPLEFVTRFIQFAREMCKPVMTAPAALVLRAAYLRERQAFALDKTELPVTPRFLQSLVRVSEARAKLELRSEVTESDAEYAVALLSSGMRSYREADGTTMIGGGVPSSVSKGKKPQKDVALDNMARLLEMRQAEGLSYDDAIRCCEDAGGKNPALMLQQLNDFGAVLVRDGKYRLKRKP